MAHPFELRHEIELDATPEEVWEAITSGPALDGWWMGMNAVEPRQGGVVRTTLPGFTMESTVTAWEPPRRFVVTSPEAEDGRLMAMEYSIEGREGGRTLLRFVHSGFLPGDDWETEYDALRNGNPAYLFKLREYLRYFRGRRAVPVSAWGPSVDGDRAWAVFRGALGLGDDASVGSSARFDGAEGLPAFEGDVDYLTRDFLGVRTADAMYRFIHGMGTVALGHHIFAPIDREATEQAWQAWLHRQFG